MTLTEEQVFGFIEAQVLDHSDGGLPGEGNQFSVEPAGAHAYVAAQAGYGIARIEGFFEQ